LGEGKRGPGKSQKKKKKSENGPWNPGSGLARVAPSGERKHRGLRERKKRDKEGENGGGIGNSQKSNTRGGELERKAGVGLRTDRIQIWG